MCKLENLLKYCGSDFTFHHLNNCIRCFLHIINICMSHIVASYTWVSKEYLKSLRFKGDDDSDNNNDNNDDDNDNNDDDNDNDNNNDNDNDNNDSDNDNALPRGHIPMLRLKNNLQFDTMSAEDWAWFSGIKHDPVKHARTVIHILHSSDQRKQNFKEVIKNGNKSGWFRAVDSSTIVVPDLEPLCDVKTQWDSTYAMIEHLVVLWPVSIPVVSGFNHGVLSVIPILAGYWLLFQHGRQWALRL